MKKNILFSLSLMAMVCATVNAQDKKYPEPEPMKPGMTEYWVPQPKAVTPGDIMTNTAPSDAIVLFDGKDLSQWENTKGEAAGWRDGQVPVVPQGGDEVLLARERDGRVRQEGRLGRARIHDGRQPSAHDRHSVPQLPRHRRREERGRREGSSGSHLPRTVHAQPQLLQSERGDDAR